MTTQCLSIHTPRIFKQQSQFSNIQKSFELDQNYQQLNKNIKMRENSIELMLKLRSKYSFKEDTLFLAIQVLDKLISIHFNDPLEDPELIGGVLILLATKYNEVYPVVIDQINLSITKYYDRDVFYLMEGMILEAINFEIPSETIYSRIYSKLELEKSQKLNADSDKENESHSSNYDTDSSQKASVTERNDWPNKLLQIVREPEVYKYGKEVLLNGFLSHFRKDKIKGISSFDIKSHQIKSIIKKVLLNASKSDSAEKIKQNSTKFSQLKGTKTSQQASSPKWSSKFCF